MRLGFIITGSVMLLSVAACGYQGTTATGATPAGAASTAPNQASQMPQAPNSLPAGAAVSAPVNSRVGAVGRTSY